MPDTGSFFPSGKMGGGILTGVRILACVSLAKIDKKVRTKPLCFRGSAQTYLDVFSVMLLLSYDS